MVKKKKTKKEKLVEKQLIKIIAFFIFIVILFFVARGVFEIMSHIEYNGLTFTKEKIGKMHFYHYAYNFKGSGGKLISIIFI